MECNGENICQVVRRWHIQLLGERPLLDLGRYRRYSVHLSRPLLQLASACSQEDLHWWNRTHGNVFTALLVKIEEGYLIHITSDIEPCFTQTHFKELAKIFRTMANRLHNRENPQVFAPQMIFLHSGFEQGKKSTITGNLPCVNTILPLESISHIFSFLELRDRIRCQLVCKTWHHISVSCQLPVKMEVCSYWPDDFAIAVDRCVTRCTKTIIFQCHHCQCEKVHCSLQTLFSLLKVKSIRLIKIVLSQCDVWADDIVAFSDALVLKFRSTLRDICNIFVLDNVRMYGLPYVDAEACSCILTRGTGSVGLDLLDLAAEVLVNKCVINTINEQQLESALDVLEKGCPPMHQEHLPLLLNRLESAASATPVVLRVLNQWQPGDPRFARISVTTDFPWENVPLESLRKLTLFVLQWHMADNWPHKAACHKY
ncbi:uncharacterized protein LOC129594981 isoform X2 [Paramacrobiotus metropolitanus]|uniref:uncharacterized protein LOC129594981 isoform X2 n=1 Tax=Paramacrobiotus metropolitanus TaxID=2943436 RepID=UPI0024459B6F|nr:uncharacterized protein LOC129594981 isoform X2 [Paramacrobiotus metropolitanus]XP_055347841.1 uncharacterized protein LOC129594981 isoform X2 [Paramacrobiotus metropolitanus]